MASKSEETKEELASCPSCGAELPEGAPEGLCRRCLVGSVLAVGEDTPNPDEPVLGTIGAYEIVERIAQGGMGAIYRARQAGLDREVAVKLIPEGKLAGTQDVERFRIEAAAAAELDHPNILPIYEVGEEDGQHYYSMPLLGGGSLAARVKDYSRNPRAVAGLVRKVAKAVHHAHRRGILHRDLKPANILLSRDGEPLVSDFGLAKRLGGRDAMLTQTGQILGSPAYIAPEIASGKAGASVASEVYALGVVLYQLLVGEVPFSGTTQMEVLRHVVDREPAKPTSVAASVPRDLETICLKCLEKDPYHRYETAAELAEDIGRWLEGRPIEARPAGVVERVVKWARRRPAVAGLVGVSLLGAASLIAVLAVSAKRIGEERDVAIEQRRAARVGAYVSDLAAAFGALERGNLGSARALVTQAGVAEGGENLRDFAWRLAWWLSQGEELRSWKAHDGEITCLAFTPEGGQLVSGSAGDGKLKFWDFSDGELLRTYPDDLGHGLAYRARREAYIGMGGLKNYEERVRGLPTHGGGSPRSLAFFPGGRYLAVGGGGTYTRVLDLEKELPYGWLDMAHANVTRVAGTDGIFAAGRELDEGPEREVVFFDAKDPSGRQPLRSLGVKGSIVASSQDGSVIVAGSQSGMLSLWRRADRFATATEKNLHIAIHQIAVAPKGDRVAITTIGESGVNLWHIHTGVVTLLAEHKAAARAVAFTPDGRFLATGGNDQAICIWVAGTGKLIRRFRGHTAPVTELVWRPDGKTLVSASADGELKEWDFEEGTILKRGDSWHAGIRTFTLSRDGTQVAGVDDVGRVKCWALDGSHYRDYQIAATGEVVRTSNDLCFYDGGDRLAVLVDGYRRGRRLRGTRIEFLDSGTLEAVSEPLQLGPGTFREIEISPDGSRLAVAMSADRGMRLWDLPSRREIEVATPWNEDRHYVCGYLKFTPDGRRILMRDWQEKTVEVHAAEDGELLAQFATGRGSGFAVSADGSMFAVGRDDNTVALWDLIAGEPIVTFPGHLYPPNVMAFSPDSTLLLSSAGSGTVRAWHIPTRREIGVVESNSGLSAMAFSRATGALVAKRIGGYIERWQIPTLDEIEARPALFGGVGE